MLFESYRPRRRGAILGTTALVAMLATGIAVGCGGGGSRAGGPGGAEPDTEAGLKAAVRAFNEALFRGDTEGSYEGFARSCRDQVGVAEWGSTLAAGKALFEGLSKVKFADLRVDEVEVGNYTPAQAEAAAIVSANGKRVDSSPRFVPYAYQDGRWVQTNCAEMKFGLK